MNPRNCRGDHLVTSGTFSLDGGTWDVDNNVRIVGDDTEVIVIDAAAVLGALGDRTLHTPGHAPGAVRLYAPELSTVFTGDTLFQGGPGATGRSFSHFSTIIDLIRGRLLTLPPKTVVRTGHGDATTIGDESLHQEEWAASR
jgi:glyoxylase-like metal-dependent hydrolase (beta-lactamase superfamily II)